LIHNVPRFNNPSSTFDNDQYLLEIITDGIEVAFEAFVDSWLDKACSNNCNDIEEVSCVQTPCCAIYPYPGQVCV
jgi:hypothetical protein